MPNLAAHVQSNLVEKKKKSMGGEMSFSPHRSFTSL